MSGTMKNKIQVRGSRIGYVYVLQESSGGDVTAVKLWSFDTLSASSLTLSIASSSDTGNSLDRNFGDGAIVRFPLEDLIIDGTDESEIASDTGGSDASGNGSISLTTIGAPSEIGNMTAFLADLVANKSNKFLIVLPLGQSFARTGQGANAKPDGFAYMFGKITNDISSAQGADNSIQIDFASNKATEFSQEIWNSPFFTNDGIAIKRGGTNDVPAANNTPIELDEQDVIALKDGEIIFKETPNT